MLTKSYHKTGRCQGTNILSAEMGKILSRIFRGMTDKQHLAKAKTMPIKFLKASGKGFFIDREGYALAIREELSSVIKTDVFCFHMKDILEYRTMDYYRRRYERN